MGLTSSKAGKAIFEKLSSEKELAFEGDETWEKLFGTDLFVDASSLEGDNLRKIVMDSYQYIVEIGGFHLFCVHKTNLSFIHKKTSETCAKDQKPGEIFATRVLDAPKVCFSEK